MNLEGTSKFSPNDTYRLLVNNAAMLKAIALQVNKVKSIVEKKPLEDVDKQFWELFDGCLDDILDNFQKKD